MIRADGEALAAAAELGLDAKTPSCPDWTVGTLLGHITLVHHFVGETLRLGGANPFESRLEVPQPARDDAAIAEFRAGLDRLLDAFSATADDAPAWNWSARPQVAAFWKRRMTHETAVHRWDTQRAHGRDEPIDGVLAVDGVDEVLDTVVPANLPADANLGGTLHLHATDPDGEWLVSVAGGTIDVRREHAKGDAAVRGTASDLMLFLWGRLGADALDIHGDPSVVARWRTVGITG